MQYRLLVSIGVFLGCAGLVFFSGAISVHAARIYVDDATFPYGDVGPSYRVFLDTEGASINTITGSLSVRGDIAIHRVTTGASVVRFWITDPVLIDGTVTFTGMIPAGISGTRVPILSLMIDGAPESAGEIVFEGGSIFLNDGLGTEQKLGATHTSILIGDVLPEERARDTVVPEPFTPEVLRDPNIADGMYAVVFSAVDKGSGIDYYEVQESATDIADESAWVRAEHWYVLTDQQRTSYVFVKAVDREGNIRVATIPPLQKGISWSVWMFGGVVLLVLLLIFGYRRVYGR